ncbi:LOB domain-containing protein 22 isoform X2 [Lotus japonicus]|uniref:LOB domain-containing protein 22 isoform X2 n=1 Tax=Lotus japonicus TaxID=34305 RepID=UPI0025906AD7|nr:LOB domain-containing protein 22 isoform X2 [Lotus japonicus]
MNNNHNHSHNNSTITTTTTITNSSRNGSRLSSGSTTQACAACKYQRRKCAPDCILAPYFPHDRQHQFLNAHKLFGVSNITKIIKYLDPPLKDQAMRTIIFQADMRATDPVGGCYKYIQDLQAQIEYHTAELDLILQQLAIFRAQAQAQQQHQHQQHVYGVDHVMNNVTDPLSLYTNQPASYNHYPHQQVQPQQDQYVMVHEATGVNNENGCSTPLQEHINTWAMHNSMSLSSLSLQGQSSNASDEYDHKPMLDMPSDHERSNELGGFDSEDLVHSDEAVLFKIDDTVIKAEADCMQQAQDHDLKE